MADTDSAQPQAQTNTPDWMTTDFTPMIGDIRWFANRVRGIVALADALEHIGSVKNATVEARARLDAAQQQHDAALHERGPS